MPTDRSSAHPHMKVFLVWICSHTQVQTVLLMHCASGAMWPGTLLCWQKPEQTAVLAGGGFLADSANDSL